MRVEDMVDRVVSRFIGTKHERDVKRLTPTVAAINALAPDYERLSDAEIRAKPCSSKPKCQSASATPIPRKTITSSAWPTRSRRR